MYRLCILVGLLAILHPQEASAAYSCSTPAILSLAPVSSQYTQKVLERADEGIAHAANNTNVIDMSSTSLYFDWLTKMTSTMNALIDTKLRLIVQEEDMNRTACMHIDLAILEGKMQEVRCKMQEAVESGHSVTFLMLSDLLDFLNDRYANLFAGGLDPFYIDEGWQVQRYFDPPQVTWCCTVLGASCEEVQPNQQCHQLKYAYKTEESCNQYCFPDDANAPEPIKVPDAMCPFHSDYLPPTNAGYGCSLEVLRQYDSSGHTPTEEELAGMEAFMQWRNDFLSEISSAVQSSNTTINSALGLNTAFNTSFGTPPRKIMYGCEGRDGPDGTTSSSFYSSNIPSDLIYNMGGTKFELRNSDPLSPLRELWNSRARIWSVQRPFSDDLQLSDPNAYIRLNQSIQTARSASRRQSAKQGAEDATLVAKGSDALYQNRKSFSQKLRSSVNNLSQASDSLSSGVRGFARNYAFFLRRSCVYRPCNEKLDTLLKILLEDSCFPYTDGTYLLDSTIYNTCKADAGL